MESEFLDNKNLGTVIVSQFRDPENNLMKAPTMKLDIEFDSNGDFVTRYQDIKHAMDKAFKYFRGLSIRTGTKGR